MKFKELYAFTIDDEREVEKTHTRKNKKTGEETTVTKKVKETVPIQVRLKRPSRRELEDAELEYSVEMSRCVKRGILTKAMLYKKYSDTGGVWSEDDAKDYGKLYKEIFDIQNEYARLETVDKKTEKQKKKIEDLKEQLASARRKIVDAESAMQSLFDHTADVKAQNRLLLWYTLMLTHIQKEDEDDPVPYFNGLDFDEKIEDYYLKEDVSDDFYLAVVKKVTTILAFWFFNQASTPDEFNSLIERVEKGDL
jgi:DNA repair exonuclease SbcCD ATPase subunit